MQFEVGETVVYPHHGAAKIVEVKKRTVRGEEKTYLKLNVAQGDLTIEVPAGVRVLSTQLDVHNAPMTLADVEGDFIAQVRVTGSMIPGTDPPKFKGKNVLPGTFQG